MERDVDSQYDYFGARYYDSRIGRWLAVDPLAEKYPGWSAYAYALGNPIMNVDPNGKDVRKPEDSRQVMAIREAYTRSSLFRALYDNVRDNRSQLLDFQSRPADGEVLATTVSEPGTGDYNVLTTTSFDPGKFPGDADLIGVLTNEPTHAVEQQGIEQLAGNPEILESVAKYLGKSVDQLKKEDFTTYFYNLLMDPTEVTGKGTNKRCTKTAKANQKKATSQAKDESDDLSKEEVTDERLFNAE